MYVEIEQGGDYNQFMGTLKLTKIPDDLKRRFKEICKERGKTMSEAVLEFIKETVGRDIMRSAVDKCRTRRYRK